MISFNFNRISLVTLILFYFTSMHIASVESLKWTVLFEPNNCTIKMDETINVKLTIRITENSVNELINSNFSVVSDNDLISLTKLQLKQENDGSYTGNFNLTGIFLGRSFVIVQLNGITPPIDSDNRLTVIVIREVRIIDTVFTVSVATLVSILYINFGAALDMKKVKASFKRPIGPCLALFCHYLFLPLVSYFLGVWLFPDNIEMQLGLFFTGVSPAGGASNVWTVILGGNLDLSIAMTTTSTFAAFGMMPLWIFTLGKTIFDRGNIPVPYRQIATYAIALVVPLGIGLLIQKYSPRCTRFLVRIIKGFSSLLIIFIIVFGIVTNLYLFKLFTWQVSQQKKKNILYLITANLLIYIFVLIYYCLLFFGIITA